MYVSVIVSDVHEYVVETLNRNALLSKLSYVDVRRNGLLAREFDCRRCKRRVVDDPVYHAWFRHEAKTKVYECFFCEHEDVIGEDFKDHLKLAHRVFLSKASLLETFLNHNAVLFVSLHFCDKCQIRASDLRVMIQHRNTCVGLVKCQTDDYTLNQDNLAEFYQKYWSRIGPNQPRDRLLRIAISSNTAFSENFFKSLLIYVF